MQRSSSSVQDMASRPAGRRRNRTGADIAQGPGRAPPVARPATAAGAGWQRHRCRTPARGGQPHASGIASTKSGVPRGYRRGRARAQGAPTARGPKLPLGSQIDRDMREIARHKMTRQPPADARRHDIQRLKDVQHRLPGRVPPGQTRGAQGDGMHQGRDGGAFCSDARAIQRGNISAFVQQALSPSATLASGGRATGAGVQPASSRPTATTAPQAPHVRISPPPAAGARPPRPATNSPPGSPRR